MSFISSIPHVAVVVVIFKNLVEDEVREVVAGQLDVDVREDLVEVVQVGADVKVQEEVVGDVQGDEVFEVPVALCVQEDVDVVVEVKRYRKVSVRSDGRR